MHAILDKKGDRVSWVFRAAYLFALIYFGAICYLFYKQASQETQISESVRKVSGWFSQMEHNSLRFVKNAEQLELYYIGYPKTIFEPLTQEQQSTFSSKKLRLYNAAKKANDRFDVFERAWGNSIESLKQSGRVPADYEGLKSLFDGYRKFFNPEKIYSTDSLDEMMALTRFIKNENETVIAAANSSFWRAHKKVLEERANKLGRLLEDFLAFALGGVILLALLIFLPVDILLKQLLRQLREDNVRIRDAVETARIADRAKSEFLANMSHEIRTPMNGVMGMAELLIKTNLNHKQKTFADIIVKSGSALLTIINDILDFSKIDAGQMELDPAPFRLAEAVEDVATLVSSKVAEKDLDMAVRIDPGLPEMVVGDVGRIRQVASNLIGNAVKFTEAGHVFVDVSGTVEEETAKLIFRIKDTGIGISPEKCERIFEKFSQVDESATRKHEGTGLGLAISSSLVELMGGRIGVESELGTGSTFWFEIDLPVHGGVSIAKKAPIEFEGSRILIVDGNEVSRAIMTENMTAWNFDSAAASSATEALAVMRTMADSEIKLDCVIVDYHMDDTTGADLATEIRGDSVLKDTPIIMLTSVDQTENGQNFSAMDIQGHLIKPVRSSLLLDTIVGALSDSQAEHSETVAGVAMARTIGSRDVGAPEIVGVQVSPDIKQEDNEDQESTFQKFIANDDAGQETSQPLPVQNRDQLSEPASPPDDDKDIDILIAEDNDVNELVFTQILEATEFSYKIAKNGRDAVEMYKRHRPKVICMDVSMPEMNGLEATKAIRKIEEPFSMHTPIVGVTAHAIKGDKETCLEAGMDDYMSKPISPDRFHEKVCKWVTKEERRRKSA